VTDDGVLRKILKSFTVVIVLIVAGAAAGIVLPRPIWSGQAGSSDRRHGILVLSNPIHTDIAVPVDADILTRFDFLRDGGLDLDSANLRYIIFGWGGRSFYTETPTWADLKAAPVLKSLSLDRSVMHVSLAGDIPLDHPTVMAVDLDGEGYRRLQRFILDGFTKQTGKPIPLSGSSYGQDDAFFEAEGYFNAFLGCNTWTAAALREAGLNSGWWTALPWMLRASLRLHNDPVRFAPGSSSGNPS
jgi:uncharacterized protein (TIGR02117 family)